MNANMHVRWMIRRDMGEVLEAEGYYNNRDPWEEEDFLRSLRERNCIGMVVEQGDTVVGFMVYNLHPRHLELVRIAVCPLSERETSAALHLMLTKLKSKLSSHRRDRVAFTADERDTQHHYAVRNNGFQAVRVERGWCEDEDGSLHDGYRFCWRLPIEQQLVQSYQKFVEAPTLVENNS